MQNGYIGCIGGGVALKQVGMVKPSKLPSKYIIRNDKLKGVFDDGKARREHLQAQGRPI